MELWVLARSCPAVLYVFSVRTPSASQEETTALKCPSSFMLALYRFVDLLCKKDLTNFDIQGVAEFELGLRGARWGAAVPASRCCLARAIPWQSHAERAARPLAAAAAPHGATANSACVAWRTRDASECRRKGLRLSSRGGRARRSAAEYQPGYDGLPGGGRRLPAFTAM